MTNDVKPVFGGRQMMVDPEQLMKNLAATASVDPRGGADGMLFVNFSGKLGIYQVGPDKDDIDPEEPWLINIGAFEDGFVCWKSNRVIAKRMVPAGAALPSYDPSEHGPFDRDGDGWYQAKSLVMRSLASGAQGLFTINSVSGVSTFAGLAKDCLQRYAAGLAPWPVVTWGKEKFQSKGFTNFKPTITIQGWLDLDHVNELGELFDDPDAEIDLAEMFEASAGGTAPKTLPKKEETNSAPPPKVEEKTTVKRNRRVNL